MSGNVIPIAVQRYIMHRTIDLEDVEEIIRELLAYAVIPEDIAAKLCSVRDDIKQALADREDKQATCSSGSSGNITLTQAGG